MLDFIDDFQNLGGNLNDVVKIEDKEGKEYVLKTVKSQNRKATINYLFQLYQSVGFLDKGDEFCYRNFIQQQEFTQLCKIKGIFVPEIFYVGNDFILTNFIKGDLYKDALKHNCRVISIFFRDLINAHENGVVFGDRWGGNELLVGNRICFFDFDIGYSDEKKESFERSKNFELATTIYRTLLYAEEKKESVNIINQILYINKSNYDLYNISKYLINYNKFYSCPKTSLAFSESQQMYKETNHYVKKIIYNIIF